MPRMESKDRARGGIHLPAQQKDHQILLYKAVARVKELAESGTCSVAKVAAEVASRACGCRTNSEATGWGVPHTESPA